MNKFSNHSLTFKTRWEVWKNGIITKSSDGRTELPIEGKVNVSIKNKYGHPLYECEQPMRSYSVGFLEDMMNGRRIAQRNVGFETPPYMIGENDAKTRVQQFAILKWFETIPTSSASNFTLESVTELSDCIRAVISTTKTILTGSGSIKEVALHDTGTYYNTSTTVLQYMNMVCRDKLATPAPFTVGNIVRLAWTLDFPKGAAAMTKNWVHNFLQNLTSNYADYKAVDGTTATGAANTGETFTKKDNCQGAADDDTMGIVIGTSGAAVSFDDYKLGAQAAHGTGSGQMQHKAMSTLSSIAHIYPTQGKAKITYSREFTNASGDAITIKEAGLVAKTALTTEGIGTAGSYLLARWLTGDVVVDNGATLKVYFEPEISADPELTSGLEGVYVLDDTFRETYPQLSYVSMIQVGYRSGKPWAEQMAYAQSLDLAGFTDWRLPRQAKSEMKTALSPANELYGIYLAKEDGAFNPALSAPTNYYWSSTEYSAPRAMNCDFSNGNVYGSVKTNYSHSARCVR